MGRSVDIPLSSDARRLFDALADAGHGVALVGGAVRDAMLGRRVRDLDAVTTASPDEIRAVCRPNEWCRRVFAVGERYGTVGVVLADGTTVEVSRLRGEAGAGDTPGAAPATVDVFADRFAADASHRDFTVNAMAAEWPGRTLLDPTGGEADLQAAVLRAPGDPQERFAEDPLRVLRAARFAAELGFDLDHATEAAMPGAAPSLARIAVERIRDELTALVLAPHPERGMHALHRTGVLAVVLPEIAALDGLGQPAFHDLDALEHTIACVAAAPATSALRWAALLHDAGKAEARTTAPDGRIRFLGHAQAGARLAGAVCERLRFSNAERAVVVHLVREHMRLGQLPLENARAVDRAVRKLDLWVPNASPPRRLASAEDALELELADLAATAHREEAPERRRVLTAALEASRERGTRRPPAAPLDGRDVMRALGLPPGPPVGAALRAVADAVAQGLVAADDRAGALGIARDAAASVSGAARRPGS